MSWLKEVIGTEKAVIAMCHLRALPGDPSFDAQLGMNWVIDKARDDLMALKMVGWMQSCSPTSLVFPISRRCVRKPLRQWHESSGN